MSVWDTCSKQTSYYNSNNPAGFWDNYFDSCPFFYTALHNWPCFLSSSDPHPLLCLQSHQHLQNGVCGSNVGKNVGPRGQGRELHLATLTAGGLRKGLNYCTSSRNFPAVISIFLSLGVEAEVRIIAPERARTPDEYWHGFPGGGGGQYPLTVPYDIIHSIQLWLSTWYTIRQHYPHTSSTLYAVTGTQWVPEGSKVTQDPPLLGNSTKEHSEHASREIFL